MKKSRKRSVALSCKPETLLLRGNEIPLGTLCCRGCGIPCDSVYPIRCECPRNDRSKWSYPKSEVTARPSLLEKGQIDLTIWWPAPRDSRRGEGTTIMPEQARELAKQLLNAAETIQPLIRFVNDGEGRPIYWEIIPCQD